MEPPTAYPGEDRDCEEARFLHSYRGGSPRRLDRW